MARVVALVAVLLGSAFGWLKQSGTIGATHVVFAGSSAVHTHSDPAHSADVDGHYERKRSRPRRTTGTPPTDAFKLSNALAEAACVSVAGAYERRKH